ncbi:MAG: AMP-binding protein [Cellulomonas sp.]|nr:AMP-binding protein [Cellulomonas sp.]
MTITTTVDPRRVAEFRRAGLWGDASLHDYWQLSVLQSPDREAVVDSRGTRWTYRQVDDVASRLAGHLAEAGVRRGDVVSIQLPNWAQFLALDVACLRLGAVVNPVLPSHRHTELRFRLERCGSTALVMPTQFRSMDYRDLAGRLADEVPTLRTVLMVENRAADGRFGSFEQAARHDPLPEQDWTPGRGSEVAAVLFTSGSEARPKGVLLTHDNVLAGERAFAYELGMGYPDRMFMPAPLAHATGYLHGMTMPFMVGATSVLLDTFTGASALAMLNAERCTAGMGATSIIADLFDACDAGERLHPDLRLLCCGGAPVPRRLLERARSFGIRVHSVYGSTESAPHTMTRADDPDEKVLRTDGRPVPGTQVKIVDPVTRRRLPAGVEGEEASRGPAVFAGYLGEPELTSEALDADGWYYSGDLAVADEDGYLRITGRIKDTIVRGGENISATEVEAIVRDHPGVKDVAVVAMPNDRLGECACAYVVLSPGAPALDLAALRHFFVERGVAKYKIPEWIEIVDALPMTPSGKVRKVELRARIADQIAADRAAGRLRAGAAGATNGQGRAAAIVRPARTSTEGP